MTTSISMSPNMLTQQLIKSPIETVIVNPNDRDFFIPLNIPYIMQYYEEVSKDDTISLDADEGNKELSIYEIDKELKRYVLCPDNMGGSISESDEL